MAQDNQAHTNSLIRVDSRTGEEDILTTMQNVTMFGWSRDGSYALASKLVEGTRILIKQDCQTGRGTELIRRSNEVYIYDGDVVSPDTKWAAIGLSPIGSSGAYRFLVLPVGEGDPRELVSGDHLMRPAFWSSDSRTLFYTQSTDQGGDELWKVSLDGGKPSKLGLSLKVGNGAQAFSLHPDGKRLAFQSFSEANEYWVMENIPSSKMATGNKK